MLDSAALDSDLWNDDRWFVYLLQTTDCSAFKIGFTCNPLQRLYSFSHRYFEHFDLASSRLLQVENELDARELEKELKRELSSHRVECPSWVSPQAGGDTEWFSLIYFADAEARLQSHAALQSRDGVLILEELVRAALTRAQPYFESWALAQAHGIDRPRPLRDRPSIAAEIRVLRDWLDAYRALQIDVYADNPAARTFLARMSAQTIA